jgi:hypothetical protein
VRGQGHGAEYNIDLALTLAGIMHELPGRLEKSKEFLTEVTETAHRDHGEVPEMLALRALCGQVVRGYRYLNHSVNSVRNVFEAAFHLCPS